MRVVVGGLGWFTEIMVSTRDGQEDSSIGIQFILKGMTSIGTNANKTTRTRYLRLLIR